MQSSACFHYVVFGEILNKMSWLNKAKENGGGQFNIGILPSIFWRSCYFGALKKFAAVVCTLLVGQKEVHVAVIVLGKGFISWDIAWAGVSAERLAD